MGGPGQDTNILVYKVFVDGFRNMDFGGSAAQSVILMVMVIILTVIQFRFIERASTTDGRRQMVENRTWLNFFTHLILILGVIVVSSPSTWRSSRRHRPPSKWNRRP